MKRNKVGQFIKGSNEGRSNPRWNGGKTIDRHGYVKILKPICPMSDSKGYVYEHRYKMSIKIGRDLTNKDIVHHINGIRNDNRIENLHLTNDSTHKKHHGKILCNLNKKRNSFKRECEVCNKVIVGGNRLKYCSKHKRYFSRVSL